MEGLKAYLIFKDKIYFLLSIMVESDAAGVIKFINHDSEDLFETTNILDVVVDFDHQVGVIVFSKCQSACNLVAHKLARVVVFPPIANRPADLSVNFVLDFF